jgi:hypothetical protein
LLTTRPDLRPLKMSTYKTKLYRNVSCDVTSEKSTFPIKFDEKKIEFEEMKEKDEAKQRYQKNNTLNFDFNVNSMFFDSFQTLLRDRES